MTNLNQLTTISTILLHLESSINIHMKITEITRPLNEDASGGATASGAVATSMGGGAGFGTSIFMRRGSAPKKTKKKKQRE